MKSLILASRFILFDTGASAAPISYTGAEFASLSGISFRTGTQTIVGDSLRIESTALNSVVARLLLDQFMVDVADFVVQIGITRLLHSGGGEDQDPSISITDDVNTFGADISWYLLGPARNVNNCRKEVGGLVYSI